MSDLAIPRILHQIWLGGLPPPAPFVEFQRGWQARHPGWQLRLWTESDLPTMRNRAEFEASASLAGKANILRYEVLATHGGVYVDADFECLRNLEPLLENVDCFVARQWDEVVNNAIMGCVPGHPFVRDLVDSLGRHVAAMPKAPSVAQSGPYYLTQVLNDHPEVSVFPWALFYPYQWHERWRRHEAFAHAYAVHHYSLSARAAELPRPRAGRGGTRVDVLISPAPENRPRALEWVLEGLCQQTISDFSVAVATRPGDAESDALIASFQSRLDVRALREGVPSREGTRRVLLLAGDCLPDPDVVATHAAVADRLTIAYGMRRLYPGRKLYRFRPPMDYPGILWHAEPDRHQEDPSRPRHSDWRSVTTSCFSVPSPTVAAPALIAAARGGEAGARRLVRTLAGAGLGWVSLSPAATVTHLLATVSGADDAFPAPSVLYRSNGAARGRRPGPARIEVVIPRHAPGEKRYAHNDYPSTTFVRLAEIPAHAGSAAGTSPSATALADNHPRRFQFRVIDPAATGDTLEIAWHTIRGDRTDHDRPPDPTLSLRRVRRGSHAFLSPALIVVADDDGEHHTQIRRADMSGAVVGEYWPNPRLPAVAVTIPVFRRRPDERRRLQALLVNYDGAATADWAMAQLRDAATALQVMGIRLELGPLRERALPRRRGRDERAAIGDLLPLTPDRSVTVVFWPGPAADAGGGWSWQGGSSDRHFVFVEAGAPSAGPALTRELLEATRRHATPLAAIGHVSGRP